MNLRDLTAIVLRRWLFVLSGLLLTAGLCIGLVFAVPVSYTALSTLVLLPPTTVVGAGGNPYLYLGGLEQALDVLTRKLNANEFSKPLEKAHPEAEFLAYADTSTSGPILVLEASGPEKASLVSLMTTAVSQVPDELRTLQTSLSVPTRSRITVAPVAVGEKPLVDFKDRIQIVAAAAAAGLMATLLLAGYRDGRVRARRARAEAEQHDDEARRPPAEADSQVDPELDFEPVLELEPESGRRRTASVR